MKNSRPKAPSGISAEARVWWTKLVAAYELDDEAAQFLLLQAMESFDRLRAAQALVEKDGLVVEDRFGQKKPNPATMIERDSRTALLRALRQLNLDVEPPVSRPGGK
jgi:P27 family predicted phage terminase small subunit